MKKNTIISIILVLAMMVSMFTGCGNTVDKGTETSKETEISNAVDVSESTESEANIKVAWDTNKKDEIVVSIISTYYNAGLQALADEYNKLHPETTVVIDGVADNKSYQLKMATVYDDVNVTGTPDIIHANLTGGAAGSYKSAVENGYMYDFESILDMDHPYQEGKVRDMFTDAHLAEMKNFFTCDYLVALPFDKCGVGFYYNKTVFEKFGLSAPTSYENLIEICKVLRENGYQYPVTAATQANAVFSGIADAAVRYMYDEFATQPGDALYDVVTMPVNSGFVYDDSDPTCDDLVIFNAERQYKAMKDGFIFSEVSRTTWSEFAKLGQYMPYNWIGGIDYLTEFENQASPIMITGTWNVGTLLQDIEAMPKDKQFDWGTFMTPDYSNPPEGFASDLRNVYTFGNVMTIIPKNNDDHNARVLDFYLFWYSKDGAQLCIEETLANGDLVQGPSCIAGVTLSGELNDRLNGFLTEGNVKRIGTNLCGYAYRLNEDKAKHDEIFNEYLAGNLNLDSFLEQLYEIQIRKVDDSIRKGNLDLDPTTTDTQAN